jgi:hypothetical protein
VTSGWPKACSAIDCDVRVVALSAEADELECPYTCTHDVM